MLKSLFLYTHLKIKLIYSPKLPRIREIYYLPVEFEEPCTSNFLGENTFLFSECFHLIFIVCDAISAFIWWYFHLFFFLWAVIFIYRTCSWLSVLFSHLTAKILTINISLIVCSLEKMWRNTFIVTQVYRLSVFIFRWQMLLQRTAVLLEGMGRSHSLWSSGKPCTLSAWASTWLQSTWAARPLFQGSLFQVLSLPVVWVSGHIQPMGLHMETLL